MSDKQRGGSGITKAMGIFLAVAVLYAFSSGPACYCNARGWISDETMQSAYWPLVTAAEHNEWVNRRLFWWSLWWSTL